MFIAHIKDRIKAHKNCTTPVIARCVRINNSLEFAEKSAEPMDENERIDVSETVAPVFEIQYNGQTIELKPHTYSNICDTEVGDVRNIYINPQNPQEYYDSEAEKSTFGWIELLVALAFVIFGAAFAILTVYLELSLS